MRPRQPVAEAALGGIIDRLKPTGRSRRQKAWPIQSDKPDSAAIVRPRSGPAASKRPAPNLQNARRTMSRRANVANLRVRHRGGLFQHSAPVSALFGWLTQATLIGFRGGYVRGKSAFHNPLIYHALCGTFLAYS